MLSVLVRLSNECEPPSFSHEPLAPPTGSRCLREHLAGYRPRERLYAILTASYNFGTLEARSGNCVEVTFWLLCNNEIGTTTVVISLLITGTDFYNKNTQQNAYEVSITPSEAVIMMDCLEFLGKNNKTKSWTSTTLTIRNLIVVAFTWYLKYTIISRTT